MKSSVWVLFGNTGEYSDHREWVVRAYTSEADAKADCAALNALAKEGDVDDSDAVVERLRQHDASASVDYTGTDYFVSEVPLVGASQIPSGSTTATTTPRETT